MSGAESLPQLIELNVGGVHYSTSLNTLTSESGSKLAQMFEKYPADSVLKDSKVSQSRFYHKKEATLKV